MNLLQQHEEAMNFSFLAKQARNTGEEDIALDNYTKAAEIETIVAQYYMDKSELEPTRSVIIRSAAFLNLKAGNIEKAEKFIFWGIINSLDEAIKNQLYDALEMCVAYRHLPSKQISGNVDYIYKMRQKSIFYAIEPKTHELSNAVSLEMISDFSNNYTKSLKAYSTSKYRNLFFNELSEQKEQEKAAQDFQDLIKPVVTSAGFGSFKFSIASDFLPRFGESPEFTKLKSNILIKFHAEIFVSEITDEEIVNFKKEFSDEEIELIFRPLLNIKSKRSDYSVSYYDRESFKRNYVHNIKINQKQKLLPKKNITIADIGQLENIISHTRVNQKGIFSRSTILKQELKSYSFDHHTSFIEPKGYSPLILKNEIIINVDFNSEIGFTFSYEDLPIEASAITYNEGLSEFYVGFISYLKYLKNTINKSDIENEHWEIIKKILESPDSITL